MKPILFLPTATVFTNNGLGRLADCVSCKVTEERNGIYEIELEYPITGIHYSEIEIGSIVCAVPADGKGIQPFEIYKITRPLNGVVTLFGEHISYRLNRIPVLPYTAQTCALALDGLKTNAAETCAFDFYTDKVIPGTWENKVPASIRERLGGTEGSILERFGGEYEFDKFDVHLWTNRGTDNGVSIRYGKNLTELEQETNIESTITGILPFWCQEETQTRVIGNIVYSSNAASFPYHRTAVIDFSSEFQEPPTEQELEDAAQDYIDRNEIGVPNVNLKVSFVALWQTEEYTNIAALERVNLCDTVTIIFERLGVSATAKVIKTVFDVLAERYTEIEVGDARGTLGDTITKISDHAAETAMNTVAGQVQTAIDSATEKLTGGLGGHVVINTNASGQPNEILIMDTDDKTTATNVIRFNESGIGFSQSGYNGPFNGFIGIGGTIDFNQIQTLNLVANMFKGGVLQLGTVDNSTGVLQVFDNQNALIGQLDKDGLKMYGSGGAYVLMNQTVGFAGFDRNGTKIYWVDQDEFHMRKAVVEDEISLCGMIRYIPVTLYDGGGNVTNEGIAMVSSN